MRWSTISANSWLIELQRVWVIEREFLNSKNCNRHRGPPVGGAPATPPGMRVRTGRFESLRFTADF